MVFEIPSNFIFDRGEVELLAISGLDSADFLNRLSTLNFKKPIEGSLHGAFLNGHAKLISLFTVWKKNDKNYFFIEKEMFKSTKEYLEKMHFAENLKIETEKLFCIEVREKNEVFPSEMSAEAYNWGIPGKYFFDTSKFEVKSILEKNYDAVRASFGFPKPMQDLTEDHILIEAPLDDLVDRNKGCYPGQEVIEKIYTYGRVAKKIKRIEFLKSAEIDFDKLKNALPLDLVIDGNNIGKLTSVYSTGTGIATIKRAYLDKDQALNINFNDSYIVAKII